MSQNVSHAAVVNGAIRDKSKRREPSLHTSNYRAISFYRCNGHLKKQNNMVALNRKSLKCITN